MRRRGVVSALLVAVGGLAGGPVAADVPRATIVLESFRATVPGQVAEAAPPRFVLLEDGTVFVGGAREVWSGRLGSAEAKALEKRVEAMRKITPLSGTVTLGPGPERRRLVLAKGKPADVRVEGATSASPPALTLLAELVRDLEAFHHSSLRPYAPASYALSAREGSLVGGCRAWTRPQKLADAVFAPLVVPADVAEGWPTGASPAHVCVGDKSYVVTLRPLLPGERP
ncbi:MAG TPA: hypothetical protein VFM29_02775 [Vicinamibacteria bacterium]|nr:hypothetical protein [Vicinamibacteria bacterium]